MVEKSFKRPSYARSAFELIRSVLLEVWWEDSTRWMRIEVFKDLGGTYGPYSVRIFLQGQFETDPWAEPSEYPYWIGETPEAALNACLDGLADRAEIATGVETRDRRPPNPGGSVIE